MCIRDRTGDIHQLTSLENFSVDQIAGLVVAFFKTEFQNGSTCRDVRLGEVTGLSLADARGATLADSDLHCAIAIGLLVFELGDAIRLDLDDRDRNEMCIRDSPWWRRYLSG